MVRLKRALSSTAGMMNSWPSTNGLSNFQIDSVVSNNDKHSKSSFDRGEVLLDRKTTGAAPKVQSDRHDWWGDEQNGGRFVHVFRKRRDRGEVRL